LVSPRVEIVAFRSMASVVLGDAHDI